MNAHDVKELLALAKEQLGFGIFCFVFFLFFLFAFFFCVVLFPINVTF